jgi:hypothetical protein
MEVTDETRIGLHELTITNYTTNTVPEIAIGSLIEVNGTLFKVNDTGGGTGMAISGIPSNGTVYVQMIPSGIAPNQILTPTFTNTAPTFWDAKQGWYDVTGVNRYIHYAMTKASAIYSPKWEFAFKKSTGVTVTDDGDLTLITGNINVTAGNITSNGIKTDNVMLKTKIIEIGDWNMDTTANKSVSHGLTYANIRAVSVLVRSDTDNIRHMSPHPSAGLTDVDLSINFIDSTTVVIARRVGGLFDNTNYDSTSYNRGWVTIIYQA